MSNGGARFWKAVQSRAKTTLSFGLWIHQVNRITLTKGAQIVLTGKISVSPQLSLPLGKWLLSTYWGFIFTAERERHKDREDKRREDYIRRESEDDTQLHCVNLFQYFYFTCSCYGLRLVFVISCFILKLCRHASCFAFMSSLCLFFPHFLHLTCVILFITPV